MITPSFGLTATERVLPKLALDFTTASLDPRITFTRADATATRVNSSGYIEVVAANTPRFDYNPVTLACNGLLIEELRKNILTYSGTFTNAAWNTVTNISVATDAAVKSPDNDVTPTYKITHNANSTVFGRSAVTITSGSTNAYTLYVKKGNTTYMRLRLANGATSVSAYFNLDTGATASNTAGGTSVAFSSKSITNAGNGWYRVALVVTTSGITTLDVTMACAQADGGASTATDYMYIWNSDLEVGAFPTSTIITDGIAGGITRNADVATMTGTNFSSWYNASEGTFVASGTFNALGSNAASYRNNIIGISDGTAGNAVQIGKSVAGYSTNTPATFSTNGTFGQQIAGALITSTSFVSKMALGLKSNNVFFAANGIAGTVDTSSSVPPATQLNIGSYDAGFATGFMNGYVKTVNYYPFKLTDSEIQSFSKG